MQNCKSNTKYYKNIMSHLCEYNYGKFVGFIVSQQQKFLRKICSFLQFSTKNNGEIWRSFTDLLQKV